MPEVQGIGWLHSVACVIALLLGFRVLTVKKGTCKHRELGRQYLLSMLVVNLSALFIYRLDRMFFPHYLAAVTLVLVVVAYWAAHCKVGRWWLQLHVFCTVASYYMLIGGGVNEAFLRASALASLEASRYEVALSCSHSLVMLVFVGLLIYFLRLASRQKGNFD